MGLITDDTGSTATCERRMSDLLIRNGLEALFPNPTSMIANVVMMRGREAG